MARIEVFDPPMCCSSGVCGPSVDQRLIDFQSALSALREQGVEVRRYNLGHQPEPFLRRPQIVEAMGPNGEQLPIVVVDGVIQSKGRYPTREELSNWSGITITEAPTNQRLKVL